MGAASPDGVLNTLPVRLERVVAWNLEGVVVEAWNGEGPMLEPPEDGGRRGVLRLLAKVISGSSWARDVRVLPGDPQGGERGGGDRGRAGGWDEGSLTFDRSFTASAWETDIVDPSTAKGSETYDVSRVTQRGFGGGVLSQVRSVTSPKGVYSGSSRRTPRHACIRNTRSE